VRARPAIVAAFGRHPSPNAGKNIGAAFYQLQLTLFHAGRLDTYMRFQRGVPVSVRGWAAVAPGITEIARWYIAQVTLSLRPSTVAHIEHDLREFGTWLAAHHPEVASCAELERPHIEQFKTWLTGSPRAAWQAPEPRMRQDTPHQSAPLLRSDRGVGLPHRTTTALDVRRGSADRRHAAPAVSR
jgi:hypothetical protein